MPEWGPPKIRNTSWSLFLLCKLKHWYLSCL